MIRFVLSLAAALAVPPLTPAAEPAAKEHETAAPVRQAHAHNDYLHERPLMDALSNGFCSVEADIYLIDGELLVAHDLDKTSKDRTLQGLYLDPLRERVAKNGGSVYGDGNHIILLIDIKSEAESTFQALHKVLAEYQDVLSHTDLSGYHQGAVTAIISGNRAFDSIKSAMPRYAGIDGRLSDLSRDPGDKLPADVMPLISDRWSTYFSWRGEGMMVPAEARRLSEAVRLAHGEGRKLRFWATPDSEPVWKLLADAKVDLINTDDLEGLAKFLRSQD